MALFAGLMSGTSLDGVDGVLAELDPEFRRPPRVLVHAHAILPSDLAQTLLALNEPGANELHRAARAGNALMVVYADVMRQLLADAGCDAGQVQAVGAHGQTVRHCPAADHTQAYTLQLANGALLAELTGITTVCDFRAADLAAGGQGAPLVPGFHAAVFGHRGRDIAVLNIGGIANLTLLSATGAVHGLDTGPGNVLMDLWCRRMTGRPYDDGGAMAASGQVHGALLAAFLSDPYFALPPPKSTGRDRFNAGWLDAWLGSVTPASAPIAAADVMTTLAELTARSVADVLHAQLPTAQQVLVCGGGAFNAHLLARCQALSRPATWSSTAAEGVPPDQVEALAFAWLAARRLTGQVSSLPSVTGARAARVLGAIYPAPNAFR
jgi:anhydro-N-acetylmuramic acid kinase